MIGVKALEANYTINSIITMQHHLDAANKYLPELAKGFRSAEKQNTLLDAAMHQVELCCIDMRRRYNQTTILF